ncbi:MAG: hypothetical protein ACFB4I_18135 [Cyanophyceae cyanobacterium]
MWKVNSAKKDGVFREQNRVLGQSYGVSVQTLLLENSQQVEEFICGEHGKLSLTDD